MVITSTFTGNWTYDNTASFVNCVTNFTVTQSLGVCTMVSKHQHLQ